MFTLYAAAGFNLYLFLPAFLMNCIAIPGIVCNLAVIYVTVRNKSLHGTANFLIALQSFLEILHQSAHLVWLFIATAGWNFIRYKWAMAWELAAVLGVNLSMVV